MKWLARLFGKKKKQPAPEIPAPRAPQYAVVQADEAPSPVVGLLLSRPEDREAFRLAFEREGLAVTAPEPREDGDWPDLRELGNPQLVVLENGPCFERVKNEQVDIIVISDGGLEPGPMGSRVYVEQRPLNLENPLGR